VREYIAQAEDERVLVSQDASGWLTKQLDVQRKQLETSEMALQRYREQNDAVTLENPQNIVVQKLAELNGAVTKAKMERLEKEAQYNQLLSTGVVPQRRWGTADDVGLAVAAVLSGSFPFSTGAVIAVDGGLHLRRL